MSQTAEYVPPQSGLLASIRSCFSQSPTLQTVLLLVRTRPPHGPLMFSRLPMYSPSVITLCVVLQACCAASWLVSLQTHKLLMQSIFMYWKDLDTAGKLS